MPLSPDLIIPSCPIDSCGDAARFGCEIGRMKARYLRIEITCDIICAYSLIGIRQLLKALEVYNQDSSCAVIYPLIRILPYRLDPQLTERAMRRQDYRATRFGDREAGTREAEIEMEKLRKIGIVPCVDGLVSSTHLAHRLHTFSLLHRPSHHLEIVLDLMTIYHTTPTHLSDLDHLSSLALRHGIFSNSTDAKRWLKGNEYDYEVKRAYAVARRMGVTGVPFFVFGGRWAASGAVGTQNFLELLSYIVHRQSAGSETPGLGLTGHPNIGGIALTAEPGT